MGKLIVGVNDLQTLYPNIAAQWHPTKNGSLTPAGIFMGSVKRVWWQCEKGHEWQAKVNQRASLNTGCPYCAGNLLIPGETDLATKFPEIAKEWHPTLNEDTTPQNVHAKGRKKAWWLCSNCGHEWQAQINNRTTHGTGCPVCSLNRRGSMAKLIVGTNDLQTTYPKIAAQWHPTKNGDLTPQDVSAGCGKKVWWQCEKGHEWTAYIENRTLRNSGCPYCAGHLATPGETDLATTFPDIAAQWHPSKNGDLTPRNVTAGYSKPVWWMCNQGHEWEVSVNSRTSMKNGCPYCAGKKVLPGFNDLASQNPKITKEWHPSKNGSLTPQEVSRGSKRIVWWLGPCGHEWEASVGNRTLNGSGCPYCAGKKILIGFNDLATKYPLIAAQWHPTKNGTLTPKDFAAKSNKKVWWQCSYGHEWYAKISERALGRYQCPICKTMR